ncbi:SDR family NAD(P)-dependent oxidoreductase [Sphingobium phenoxybenzoativorans]|uniref:SDR family NAD(P)-dependent oxidoreductase n=1 Tax=Sphingobium phenoxybenzoativorans TaxID=1592790 RepID=UPI0008727ED5|nr:SDR family oxidoreductase [Sphingobium phenoxybenzoativorans]
MTRAVKSEACASAARPLDGLVALVTGAGAGIGAAVAAQFARAGGRLLLVSRTEGPVRLEAERIRDAGDVADYMEADVSSRTVVEATVARAIEQYGRLDIIVHNAAAMAPASLGDLDDAALDAVFDVNLKPAFWYTAAALPHLRASGAGRLLMTSSIIGIRQSLPGFSAYGASKAALGGFIRQAGYELARDAITVNGVEPGFTRTDRMSDAMSSEALKAIEARIPRGRGATPEDIAAALLFLATPAAAHITGQTLVVDGGQSLGAAHFSS